MDLTLDVWRQGGPHGEGRFVTANAREMDSRAAPADRWYIRLELNLDGLDAALR